MGSGAEQEVPEFVRDHVSKDNVEIQAVLICKPRDFGR